MKIIKIKESFINNKERLQAGFGRVFCDHMLVCDYKNGQWQEPVIQPYGPLSMEPSMVALHYGQSIFEGMKAFKTKQGIVTSLRIEKNWERLNRSAKRFCMPEIKKDLFVECLDELIKIDHAWVPSDKEHSLYIRPFMFGSDNKIGINPSEAYKFIILIVVLPIYIAEPFRAKIELQYTRASKGGVGYVKAAGNYAPALHPTNLAIKEGMNQIIWTDGIKHEYIEEMGPANIVVVKEGKLLAPSPLSDTILDGITSDSILQLARHLGYATESRPISVKELVEGIKSKQITEMFACGTAVAVNSIACISYKGKHLSLAPLHENNVAGQLLKAYNDIKYGIADDVFSWRHDYPSPGQ